MMFYPMFGNVPGIDSRSVEVSRSATTDIQIKCLKIVPTNNKIVIFETKILSGSFPQMCCCARKHTVLAGVGGARRRWSGGIRRAPEQGQSGHCLSRLPREGQWGWKKQKLNIGSRKPETKPGPDPNKFWSVQKFEQINNMQICSWIFLHFIFEIIETEIIVILT